MHVVDDTNRRRSVLDRIDGLRTVVPVPIGTEQMAPRAEAVMRRKAHHDNPTAREPLDAAGFLGDEARPEQQLTDPDLRDRVARLEIQVMQQYTAMAAYATIGQQQVETAQSELRGDIDRAQAMTVGLLDRTRRELLEQLEAARQAAADTPSGAGGDSGNAARLDVLEQRFEALANALERSVQNQMALAEQLASLLEEKMQREGWLVANGAAGQLSLR
jgi:hypothetical protein